MTNGNDASSHVGEKEAESIVSPRQLQQQFWIWGFKARVVTAPMVNFKKEQVQNGWMELWVGSFWVQVQSLRENLCPFDMALNSIGLLGGDFIGEAKIATLCYAKPSLFPVLSILAFSKSAKFLSLTTAASPLPTPKSTSPNFRFRSAILNGISGGGVQAVECQK